MLPSADQLFKNLGFHTTSAVPQTDHRIEAVIKEKGAELSWITVIN